MNPLAAIKSALSGVQRPAVGGGSPVPRFGPRVAAAPTKPSGATPGLAAMLSRPKRNREPGFKKTAPPKGGGMPPMAGGAGLM